MLYAQHLLTIVRNINDSISVLHNIFITHLELYRTTKRPLLDMARH